MRRFLRAFSSWRDEIRKGGEEEEGGRQGRKKKEKDGGGEETEREKKRKRRSEKVITRQRKEDIDPRVLYRIFCQGGGEQVNLIPFPFIFPHFTYYNKWQNSRGGGGEVSQGGDIPGSPPLCIKPRTHAHTCNIIKNFSMY